MTKATSQEQGRVNKYASFESLILVPYTALNLFLSVSIIMTANNVAKEYCIPVQVRIKD
jgi:hypothetical protein